MHAFQFVAPIAAVSALFLLATFLIAKSRQAAWCIFALLTLTSLALMAVSIHRMIVWNGDFTTATGALFETNDPLETKIITPQQLAGHFWAVSDATFWLFWPMVASNVLWIAGGLLLLRRTRRGESAAKDQAGRL